MAVMHAVHILHARVSYPLDDKNQINFDTGLFLRLRHDDPFLVSFLLSALADDRHEYNKDNVIVIPMEAYFASYEQLSEQQQCVVLTRAHYVANRFCREKLVIKPTESDFTLSFLPAEALSATFG